MDTRSCITRIKFKKNEIQQNSQSFDDVEHGSVHVCDILFVVCDNACCKYMFF